MTSFSKSPKLNWRTHLLDQFKRKDYEAASSNVSGTDTRPFQNLINAVYYPNWRVHRKQPPSSLNLEYISHIFYAFAWVREDGSIYLSDEYADTQTDINGIKGCLNDLHSIKKQHPRIKTLLSLGGGGKGSEPFPALASHETSRQNLAHSAKEIIETYSLNGIDIDWEHPSTPLEGQHYIELLAALRTSIPSPHYILTSALPAGEWALRNINLAQASAHLDYINTMTYDFAGPWTETCGHHAQLHTPKKPHNDAARTSCSSAVSYMTSQGVPANKIILGIPAYGRSFLGAKKIGDRFSGHGGQEGTFEYRDLPRPGSAVNFDQTAGAVTCVGEEGGFVTYDDPRTVGMKAAFAKKQGLGGLFYWTGTGDTNGAESLVETGWRILHGM